MKNAALTILLVGTISLVSAQIPAIFTDLHILPMKKQEYKDYTGYELDNYFFM